MKNRILILIIISLSIIISKAGTPESAVEKWEQANRYYQEEQYTSAILLYEELLSGDSHSSKLYYNLGNAYFKNNNIGKAILNYSRAQLISPNDDNIEYNLTLAKARTIDKIEPLPQFFLTTWIKKNGDLIGSNGWAILSLIFLILTLSGVLLWLIAGALKWRKLGFYIGISAMVLMILSFIYAQSSYSRQLYTSDAIITNSAVPVKSAPSGSGKDLFLIHEGTKVAILDKLEEWSEIRIEDGNQGWILNSSFEKIIAE